MTFESIPHRIFGHATTRPSAPAYYIRSNGTWTATPWGTFADEVRDAGRALMALGVATGDATSILGFNRPDWVIFNLATMAIGAASAGIYTTSSPVEAHYVTNHCEAKVILVENEAQLAKIREMRDQLPHLTHAVMMRGAPVVDDGDWVLTWEDFIKRAEEVPAADFEERLDALRPDQLATLIYTSGTTGPPKGVMLTHDNLAFTAGVALDIVEVGPDDCVISYLPLSHIAEQMFTVHVAATAGYAVYYAESIDRVLDNLKEVQPTLFFGVPRIWEKFHAGLASKLDAATGIKGSIARWAMGVGKEVSALKMVGQEPSGMLGFKYGLATKLFFSKVKPAVGLGRARVCVSGAAPIGREVLEFLSSLDIIIHEVYGQSEDCGPTTFNRPGRTRLGSVGPAIPGVEVKTETTGGDDVMEGEGGEILVKGRNVFAGYYKDANATNETLVDGWLHSGDLGRFDADGFLYITGRKKEIIITAAGKNIAPKNIEAGIKNISFINEAVVIGDRRKYLTALVTLDPDAAAAYAAARNIAPEAVYQDEALHAEIDAGMAKLNSTMAPVSQIKKFAILPRNLSIDEGELTPTLKVKRSAVDRSFADVIASLYPD